MFIYISRLVYCLLFSVFLLNPASAGNILLGVGAQADADATVENIAIGTNAHAGGSGGAVGLIAIGELAENRGGYSIQTAVGYKSKTTANDAVSYGNESLSDGTYATSIGALSESIAASTAIGAKAAAKFTNSVALGFSSVTEKAVSTSGSIIGETQYNFAGDIADSEVSVGSDTLKRIVANIAAGRLSAISTDAVNGSQLFAAIQAIQQLNENIKQIKSTMCAYSPFMPCARCAPVSPCTQCGL